MIDRKIVPEEKRVWFSIAAHIMEVVMPDTVDLERLLPSLQPFSCNSSGGKEVMCSLRITESPMDIEADSAKVLYEVSGVLGYWFCLMETEKKYIVDIQFVENGNHFQMISDKTFSTATAYVDFEDKFANYIVSLFLMIVFAQSAVLRKTILIHASVIEKEQKGYAFLGKSGMGKSTHSSLWLRYVEGAELLNDDNPAIRIEEDGSVSVYGTPWSGKTPCYKNRQAQLKAMVRLEQAQANRFTWKKGIDALITILPGCTSMRWNELLYTEMCNLLEEIIGKVKIGYLACLPNRDAALLCYEEMKKI